MYRLDEGTKEKLEQEGIKVETVIAKDFPEEPHKPEKGEFKTDEDFNNHKIEVLEYNNEMDEIQEKIDKEELRKVS